MKKALAPLLAMAIVSVGVYTAHACTTFCLKNSGEVLFGKNYDWNIGDGLLFVNKRNVEKEGAADTNAAKWVSKYGSVTFNQYGRENPSGGMNEAGLVIELMWLDDTEYPKAKNTPTVDVLEWIQYNLDTAATVDEVIKNAATLVIDSDVKLHYLVNDASGNSAAIEYLGGKFVPHTGDALPVHTLTNDTYERSLEYLKKADPARTLGSGSLERFARAAAKTSEFDKKPKTEKEAVDYAFGILGNVAQPGATQWSIVYDQKRRKIYFRTLQNPQIRVIETKMFDYACGSKVRIYDVNAKDTGDVTPLFKDYTRAANRDLIERSFNGTAFLKRTPAVVRNMLAAYPEDYPCVATTPAKVTTARQAGDPESFLSKAFPLVFLQNVQLY